ncbi:MAG: hypothetical protein R3254_04900, partial [Thiomicrorhabdus sp.]|nr:hypothetical protein [Thiomicrorhabdus sp.]
MMRWLILLLFCSLAPVAAAQTKVVEIDETAINIEVISPKVAADAKTPMARLLWLPSEYGVLQQEKNIAEKLAEQGLESWFVDFYEAMFLSPTPSAVDKINPDWTAQIIALAQQNDRYANEHIPLWIIAPNKAAQTAVRALQPILSQPQNRIGLILINPNSYLQTPSPGLVAD